MSTALQNSHFGSSDAAIAQKHKDFSLESALEMSDEENIFNTQHWIF